jgi:alpha-glucosidase
MDRDDQPIVEFITRAAETAAKYHLFLDMHGMYKPGGLNRTYPNLLNFEGVYGLENMKWAEPTVDQMKYDVSIPFIRQAAGPLDYTQGAMHNATRANYAPSNTEPMSQGTRCHQLAMYVVYDSPFNMLCDAPTNYEREPESLAFIADVPTVWDETRILDGRLGEYIITARRKGTTWYVGGMTDWTPRDLVIDCSFLDAGNYRAVLFKDGVNADRRPTDYRRTAFTTERTQKLTIHVAPGGGFALKMESAQ